VIPNATISAVADSPAEVIQAAWNRCRLAALDATPRIATRTLIPITAPICWNIETIALPVAVCSGARLTVADRDQGWERQSPTCSYGEPAEQKAAHVVRRLTDRQCEQCRPETNQNSPAAAIAPVGSLVFRRRFSAIPAKIGTITGPERWPIPF